MSTNRWTLRGRKILMKQTPMWIVCFSAQMNMCVLQIPHQKNFNHRGRVVWGIVDYIQRLRVWKWPLTGLSRDSRSISDPVFIETIILFTKATSYGRFTINARVDAASPLWRCSKSLNTEYSTRNLSILGVHWFESFRVLALLSKHLFAVNVHRKTKLYFLRVEIRFPRFNRNNFLVWKHDM